MTTPLDLDQIEARAAAAPGGYWVPLHTRIWLPWTGPDDTGPVSAHDTGRYITVEDGDWHGTTAPPPGLWAFIAAARDDVPALCAEVRRLRAALASHGQPRPGEWACHRCGAAYFGTPPGDGLCPSGCQPAGGQR
jgi:hypothetical protein